MKLCQQCAAVLSSRFLGKGTVRQTSPSCSCCCCWHCSPSVRITKRRVLERRVLLVAHCYRVTSSLEAKSITPITTVTTDLHFNVRHIHSTALAGKSKKVRNFSRIVWSQSREIRVFAACGFANPRQVCIAYIQSPNSIYSEIFITSMTPVSSWAFCWEAGGQLI